MEKIEINLPFFLVDSSHTTSNSVTMKQTNSVLHDEMSKERPGKRMPKSRDQNVNRNIARAENFTSHGRAVTWRGSAPDES